MNDNFSIFEIDKQLPDVTITFVSANNLWWPQLIKSLHNTQPQILELLLRIGLGVTELMELVGSVNAMGTDSISL